MIRLVEESRIITKGTPNVINTSYGFAGKPIALGRSMYLAQILSIASQGKHPQPYDDVIISSLEVDMEHVLQCSQNKLKWKRKDNEDRLSLKISEKKDSLQNREKNEKLNSRTFNYFQITYKCSSYISLHFVKHLEILQQDPKLFS